MGLQMARLVLQSSNWIIGAVAPVRALQHYSKLPSECKVPVKFGLWGEVISTWNFKSAYLIYPGLSLCIAFGPSIARASGKWNPDVPSWVRDEKMFRALETCANEATMLATGVILLAATEQVPLIIAGSQKALLPEKLVPYCIAGTIVSLSSFYFLAKRIAG